MKNLMLTTVALFTLSTGVAFAENPNWGVLEELQPSASGAQTSSYGAPSVSLRALQSGDTEYVNPAANRYGDASPRS